MLNRSGFRMMHYYRKVLSDKSPLVSNVRRYVHVAAVWGWHGFLPSFWMWRFFRFTKSSRNAKTMTPGGSAQAFSRGQPSGGHISLLCCLAFFHRKKAIAYTDLLYAVLFIYLIYIMYSIPIHYYHVEPRNLSALILQPFYSQGQIDNLS